MQRVPAKIEYLEFEPQPAANKPKIEKDIQTRIDNKEWDQSQANEDQEAKDHKIEGIRNNRTQAKLVRNIEPEDVCRSGLVRSFRASAKGTKKPESEGLFGPRRNIIYAKTLRSSNVKKATATNNNNREARATIK